jgi:hypothetical protein
MSPQLIRAEVVSSGIVVVFDDEREAYLETTEVLALAVQVDAFERANMLGADHDSATSEQ